MFRIAVIGVGPRGLSAVERIISHARRPGPPIELTLIEPGELGNGVHSCDQPDYLLLNTIAAQLTIFSDERMTPGQPVTRGPSLYEWCLARRMPVRFDSFLPRRLLAEYLQWAAGELLSQRPPRLRVRRLRTVAVGLADPADGVRIELADGSTVSVDLALVTTGHGIVTGARSDRTEPGGALIENPYPLPTQLASVPAGARLGVLGTGLTAMDVIAAVTTGRGGRFEDGRYLASGAEPRIVLVNRSGQLPCARPNTQADRQATPARYLTSEAIDRLRENVPGGKLDFRRDVEPLIRLEVEHRMTGASDHDQLVAAERLRPTVRRSADYDAYVTGQLDAARADLAESRLGLGRSRIKDGLECLRDHRAALRSALDGPGLTEQSHAYFMTEFAPLVNRTVIGPQLERIEELLALIAAGVVVLGPGPRPDLLRTDEGWLVRSSHLDQPFELACDVLVKANLNWPGAGPDQDPIGHALRRWARPGVTGWPTLALDRDGCPVRLVPLDGPPAVAVFGPPAEGASYYNHYVPSPSQPSRILADLDRVLGPALARRSEPSTQAEPAAFLAPAERLKVPELAVLPEPAS